MAAQGEDNDKAWKERTISIGQSAFRGCTNLEAAFIKATVTSVGTAAFMGCEKLERVAFAYGPTDVGVLAFSDCKNLLRLSWLGIDKTAAKGLGSVRMSAFRNCEKLETVALSDSMTEIPQAAFDSFTGLKTIEIPESVKTIGKSAFHNCTNLESINIPGTVTSVGEQAFASCSKLKTIVLNDGIQTVGSNAFAGCAALTEMTLPKSATFEKDVFTDFEPITIIRYSGSRADWKKTNLSTNDFYMARIYYNVNASHEHKFVTYHCTYPDSCTEAGWEEEVCSICGLVKNKSVIPASHHFSKWKTTKNATALSTAVQTRTCSVCGKKETRNYGKKLAPTMKLTATKLPLKTGQKTSVLKVSGLAKGDSIVSWKSSNTKIAKISGKSNGTSTITAGKKTGKATITIKLKSGYSKKVTITVQKTAVKTTKITGVAKTLKLKTKQSKTLKPVIAPLTSLQKVTYKSSNKKVATVNTKGKITAKKKGTAVITVKSGSKTVKCKVTVK